MVSVQSVSNASQANANTVKKTNSSNETSFDSYLGESSSMDKIFDKAAKKYDVPVELLKAMGKAESNFDAKAVSRCGAQGVMQLMPATAKSLGVTNSLDAEQNIMGGAKYISGLLEKYDGNVKLALAAYNAGSGNVAKYNGIPPFKETQNYVKKIVGFMAEAGSDTTVSNSTSTKETNANEITNKDTTKKETTTNITNWKDTTAKDSTANDTTTNNSAANQASNNILANTPLDISSTTMNAANVTDVLDGALSSDLDNIFTYDDYLKFLNQFLEDEKNKESQDNSNTYASKQINYSLPVMNLIKSMNV